MTDKSLHVFTPGDVETIKGRIRPRAFEGENPPRGVVLNYHIRDEHDGPLTIEITDSDGDRVRSYSSEEGDFERCIIANKDQRLPFDVEYPPKAQGANKWVWDMRRDGLHCIDDIRLFEGFAGAYVMPGTYHARVSIGDAEETVTLALVADRRVEASDGDFAEVEQKIGRITALMNELLDGLAAIRKSRAQIEALIADFPDTASLQQSGSSAVERLTAWEEKVLQVEFETYEDEDNLPGKLVKQVRHLLDVIDDAGPPVAAGAKERLADLVDEWAGLQAELREIEASDIAAVNNWASTNAVPHISPPNAGR